MSSILSNLTEKEYKRVWKTLLYPTTYISSMTTDKLFDTLWSQQLIVDCSFSGTLRARDLACSNVTYLTWDPTYQASCYTIHVPENMKKVRLFGFINRDKLKVVHHPYLFRKQHK